MDFTLEDWEQLGLDQGDLFWDSALDNYQNLFLLNPLRPTLTACSDGLEELEALARSSPAAVGPDTTQSEPAVLAREFLEEGLSPEVLETFSKDDLCSSSFEDVCVDESWLDSLLGDPKSPLRASVPNTDSPAKCEGRALERGPSPGPQLPTEEESVVPDPPAESPTPAKSEDCRADPGRGSAQRQQGAEQGEAQPYKCNECGVHFSSTHHLILHWVGHARETLAVRHECPLERAFSQNPCLSARPALPAGQQSHVCNECGQTFAQSAQLLWHQKTHAEGRPSESAEATRPAVPQAPPCGPGPVPVQHQPAQSRYQCPQCQEAFGLRKLLVRHQRTHAARALAACPECGKTFRQSASLVEHRATHTGEKPYKCGECGKAFSHAATLKIHERGHSGQQPFRCGECGKAFGRSSHLHEHRRVHTGCRPHPCAQCGRSFNRPSHLRRHQLAHAAQQLHRCGQCQAAFSHKDQLERHQQAHGAEPPHCCPQCGERFLCGATLRCHLRGHGAEEQRPDASGGALTEAAGPPEKPFKCDECGKTFGCSKYLAQHQRVHASVKPFLCAQCGKAFGHPAQLTRHQRAHGRGKAAPSEAPLPEREPPPSDEPSSQRPGEPPLQCGPCGKVFSRRASLAQHRRRVHSREKPHACGVCEKAFALGTQLLRHQRAHSREKLFVCGECGKAFGQSSCLAIHQRVHSGEKPFVCGVCGKAFSQSSCLAIHQRVHSGEKPFVCGVCGKAFAQKAQLGQHERAHSGEKPFTCGECGRGFAFSSHLSQHRRVHRREQPCPRPPQGRQSPGPPAAAH